jgi:hypothetical protein
MTLAQIAEGNRMSIDRAADFFRPLLAEAAMSEITESLFSKAELNSMLKDHHEYLDMYQDNVRRRGPYIEELEALRKAS